MEPPPGVTYVLVAKHGPAGVDSVGVYLGRLNGHVFKLLMLGRRIEAAQAVFGFAK